MKTKSDQANYSLIYLCSTKSSSKKQKQNKLKKKMHKKSGKYWTKIIRQKNALKKNVKTNWHNSGTLNQLQWSRIILRKLDTIVYPHTNQRTTLLLLILLLLHIYI